MTVLERGKNLCWRFRRCCNIAGSDGGHRTLVVGACTNTKIGKKRARNPLTRVWWSPSASCHERCSTPGLRSDHRHEMALTLSQCKASRAPLFVTSRQTSHALPVVLWLLARPQESGVSRGATGRASGALKDPSDATGSGRRTKDPPTRETRWIFSASVK
jgi:hypothetical protein